MNIKASGRSALILATGFWMCFAGTVASAAARCAADSSSGTDRTRQVRQARHHWKKYAHHKSGKVAAEIRRRQESCRDRCRTTTPTNRAAHPASVANANAQLASANTPAGSAQAMTDARQQYLQAAPDNPRRRAAPDSPGRVPPISSTMSIARCTKRSRAAAPLAMASAEHRRPQRAVAAVSASSESSTWDQTSLIGKIFIGFGALLTMASAARMFMA